MWSREIARELHPGEIHKEMHARSCCDATHVKMEGLGPWHDAIGVLIDVEYVSSVFDEVFDVVIEDVCGLNFDKWNS